MPEKRQISEIQLTILLILASALLVFSSCNKYWGPYDEGIVTVAAERLLIGEVPYRDFFIIMYPPGQVFALASLYKIFGVTLGVGRIYTGFIQVFIAMLVYIMCRQLTGKRSVSLLCWLIGLMCLGPRLGTIPSPIWPGVCFGLFSLYLFGIYIIKEKKYFLLLCGLSAGIAALFRYDIGIFAFASIFIALITARKGIRTLASFLLFFIIFPAIISLYLFANGAIRDAFESLCVFPFIHQKTANIAFPSPCFNPLMIFHQSLHFIKINQYYIPILVYLLIALSLIKDFIKTRVLSRKRVYLIALLLFGVLTFNQARIRTDPAHLLTVIFPAIILFGFIAYAAFYEKINNKLGRYIYVALAILILFLFTLLFIKNTDKYVKNVFRKPLKNKISKTIFDIGTVYVPEEDLDIKDAVSFIKQSTKKGDKVYIGNMVHWKDDFGGSLILYTLSARLPSTKYYELAPGLVTQKKVQEEIVSSLSKNNVEFIVLQDIELGDTDKRTIDPDEVILDNYIKSKYKPAKKIGKYNIYRKLKN